MIQKIIDYLDILYPNPKCELKYNKDYELLIAVMMSAQTTDKKVNMVNDVLFKKYNTLEKLSKADLNDIIEIIRPIGTYNKKAQNIINISSHLLNEKDGVVPNDRNYLESLNGVGRKTTNVVLSNLFNEPCIAVDTHVSRVSKRLNLCKANDDVLTIEKILNRVFPKDKLSNLHHQLVLFGRYKCKSVRPICTDCKLKDMCNYNINKNI